MATVKGDSKNTFPWNSVLYPVGTGLASGYALHKMDRAYFNIVSTGDKMTHVNERKLTHLS